MDLRAQRAVECSVEDFVDKYTNTYCVLLYRVARFRDQSSEQLRERCEIGRTRNCGG